MQHTHQSRHRGQNDISKRRLRRPRPHRWPLANLQPGQVAFLVVCHQSAAGGLIGPSGSIVSRISLETDCIVSVDEPVNGSEHRVIVVVGTGSQERRLVLEKDAWAGEELVSNAQLAVLRVVERMWKVYGGGGGGGGSQGFCGLLAAESQIGVVVGKGGRTIARLKQVSGAHINILPPPPCASPNEQLIQITGSVVSVKRAIVVVTSCLQACSPYDRSQIPMTVRPIERRFSSSTTMSYDQHLEFFPHLSSMTGHSVDTDDSRLSNGDEKLSKDTKGEMQEVSFRFLVSDIAAGGIIGKGGSVVRSLENQTGASIRVAPWRTRSGDRVVIVSALENAESRYSPAQTAAVLVFARSIENCFEKGRSSGLMDGTHVSGRLLVDQAQVYFLTGGSGMIDAEVAEGATVKLHTTEDDNVQATEDLILEITGEYEHVQNTLSRVITKLRDNIFPSNMLEAATSNRSTERVADVTTPKLLQSAQGVQSSDRVQEDLFRAGISQRGSSDSTEEQSGEGRTATMKSSNGNGLSSSSTVSELERCLRFLLPREVLKVVEPKVVGGGSSETKPGIPNGLGESTATVGTKVNGALGLSDLKCASLPVLEKVRRIADSEKHSTTLQPGAAGERKQPADETVEVAVSAEVIDTVYGKNGSNLDNIRKISGAKIEVLDHDSAGKGEVRIVISGAPNESNVAQSLLQASILLGR